MSELTDFLFEEYGEFYTAEKNIHLKTGEISKAEKKLEDYLKTCKDKDIKITKIDRVKLKYKDGSWVCIRKSDTETLLWLISEASTFFKLNNLIEKLEKIIF